MLLYIEKLIFGGLGLSRTKDGVVFVEQVIPGETVEAEIVGEKSHTPVAYPVKIIEKSPLRRKSPCKYYGICGGCNFQYLEYFQQLNSKKDMFIECLQRIGKINDIPDIELFDSPEWEYRIRAQIKVDLEKENLGFFKKKTNEVVSIEQCPLLVPEINTVFRKQKEVVSNLTNRIKQIKIIAGDDNVTAFPVIPDITKNQAKIKVSNRVFSVTGESFFQGNRFLLEKMGTWAKPYVKGNFFIDMFGGIGFFSIILGDKFSRGLLIENNTPQVKCAQRNFAENKMSHIDTEAISAEKYLSRKNPPKTDCLIVDPPRPGLTRKVREGIRDLQPESILYISCNPSTQARDVGFFTKKCGYTIKKAALFDLYPQTHHMETGLLLSYG